VIFLERRNFVISAFLWFLVFFFGYSDKKVGRLGSLKSADASMLNDNDNDNLLVTEKLENLTQEVNIQKTLLEETTKKISYPEKQSYLYSLFYNKLRKNEPVKIVCRGASTTYGQDTFSKDRRPAPTDTLPNGTQYYHERASITYPEALSTRLNSIYNNLVTVINQGYSGDGVKLGYERWLNNVNSNLTIISYGINDATADWIDYKGNIEEYLKWSRKMIERELDWGSAVIIFLPQKRRYTTDPQITSFTQANYLLGQEYGIPVIDTQLMMANFPSSIYCDDSHFNGRGYNIYGSKIAALFIGNGAHNPLTVGKGSILLTRKTIDGVIYNTNAIATAGNYATPQEIPAGSIVLNLKHGSKVTYSFYVEKENMVVFPSIYCSDPSATFTYTLDFGVEQAEYSIDYSVGLSLAVTNNKPLSSISFDKTKFNRDDKKVLALGFCKSKNDPYLMVSTKGWHTLTIECTRTEPLSNDVTLLGVEFTDLETIDSIEKINSPATVSSRNTSYRFVVGTDNVVQFPYTVVPIFDIEKALTITFDDSEFFKNPALRITVTSPIQGVVSYIFIVGGKTSGSGFYLANEKQTYSPSGTFDSVNARILNSVSYNATTKELKFTWGGNVARRSNVAITIA
jgi:lysophospholipase L1-like esterase